MRMRGVVPVKGGWAVAPNYYDHPVTPQKKKLRIDAFLPPQISTHNPLNWGGAFKKDTLE